MDKLPKVVKTVEDFFVHKKLWYNLSQNLKAESCADASNKRNRIGHVGIPIFDELKSNFGTYMDKNGQKRYAMLHCRGNQKIDYDKVRNQIGSSFTRLEKEQLTELFSLNYGLVNPFMKIQTEEGILHIFDSTVQQEYFPPHTMMTNASHFEWGVEFRPKELIKNLTNVKVLNIISDETKPSMKRHTVGILTGNGPDSGIMLWNEINSNVRTSLQRHFLGDLSFPKIIIESVPEMGLSMELQLRISETKNIVLRSIENLCKQGATLICIACNTTQYFVEEINLICDKYDAEYVSMPDVVDSFLQDKGINHFDFLGIKYVTDFSRWSAFSILNSKYQIEIPSTRVLQRINDLAFRVKTENVDETGRNKLRDLISQSTKTNTIIIALTEISILLASQRKKTKGERIFIDTLSLLAKEIARRYVNGIQGIFNTNSNVNSGLQLKRP